MEKKMSEIRVNEKGIYSMSKINGEKDLKPKPRMISLNPPPKDGNCQCCGRHISELKPFDGAGDFFLDDFDGAYLAKKIRPDGPYDEEAEVVSQAAFECYENDGFDNPLDWMIEKYGKEKGEGLFYRAMSYGTARSSWECRNCFVLDTNEYHETLHQREKIIGT